MKHVNKITPGSDQTTGGKTQDIENDLDKSSDEAIYSHSTTDFSICQDDFDVDDEFLCTDPDPMEDIEREIARDEEAFHESDLAQLRGKSDTAPPVQKGSSALSDEEWLAAYRKDSLVTLERVLGQVEEDMERYMSLHSGYQNYLRMPEEERAKVRPELFSIFVDQMFTQTRAALKQADAANEELGKDYAEKFFVSENRCDAYKKIDLSQIAFLLKKFFTVEGIDAKYSPNPLLTEFVDDYDDPMAGVHLELKDSKARVIELVKKVQKKFPSTQVKEVFDYLYVDVPKVFQTEDAELIPTKNCLINRVTKERRPFSSDVVITSKVHTELVEERPPVPEFTNDDGTVWNYDEWLLEILGSQENVDLFYEIVVSCLCIDFSADSFVFFYSPSGSNGKGTLLHMLTHLIGGHSAYGCTSLSLNDFETSSNLDGIAQARLNVSHESKVSGFLEDASVIKAIGSGDPFHVNPKYRDAYTIMPKIRMLFSVNEMPAIRDKTDAFLRRLIILKFDKRFIGDKDNKRIKQEYVVSDKVLQYVLYKAIYDYGHITRITPTAESEQLKRAFKRANDSVSDYWESNEDFINSLQCDLIPWPLLHLHYLTWIRSNDSGAEVGINSFKDRMIALLGNSDHWQHVENKRYRINFDDCRSVINASAWRELGTQNFYYELTKVENHSGAHRFFEKFSESLDSKETADLITWVLPGELLDHHRVGLGKGSYTKGYSAIENGSKGRLVPSQIRGIERK